MANDIFSQIVEIILDFINGTQKNAAPQASAPIPTPVVAEEKEGIDWTNGASLVTPNFTVNDCLYLHNWKRLATKEDGADFDKLEELCKKMEEVRSILGCPINVHCGFRSQEYNKAQGILAADVHSKSIAIDFDSSPHLTIQQVKDKLEPQLEKLGMRMEKGTTTWVHLDLRAPGPSGRYFTP